MSRIRLCGGTNLRFNLTQKYMAMYAYLSSLVKEIYSNLHEAQKQVVQYISDNCSRVGIELFLAPSVVVKHFCNISVQ